jgi:phage FluMu protein Com
LAVVESTSTWSKCPKCTFLAMPEELEEHMGIHRSTRLAATAHLTTGGDTDNAANSTEQLGEQVEKEKKSCKVCQKLLAPSSLSRHVKDKQGGSHECDM